MRQPREDGRAEAQPDEVHGCVGADEPAGVGDDGGQVLTPTVGKVVGAVARRP